VFATVVVVVAAAYALGRKQAATSLPPAPTSAAIPSPPPLPGITGIFIEPGDGREPILDELAAARNTIDVEIYIITDDVILQALEAAQVRGVEVRVMLEEHPFGGSGGQQEIFDRLEAAGIDVRWANPAFRFSHIKMMVIDDAVAIILNQNLTASSFTGNREFGVVTTEPAAVETAAAIFAADWERGPEPDPGPLVVSPSNARQVLRELIDGATTSLDIYAEVLRDPEMLEAMVAAVERGATVRVLISPSSDFEAEVAALIEGGVDVRLLSNLYVHAKVIVADGARAYLGSQNFSATSLDQNRELGVIVDDPVSLSRLMRTFEIDFRAAQEAAP
jgi:phosphatidylserine/phosphatidylglycerophosphate/cardiolipin synthase-like enzyme